MTDVDSAHGIPLGSGLWHSGRMRDGEEILLTIVTVVRREHVALRSTMDSLVEAGLGQCELIVIEGDDRDSEAASVLRQRGVNDFRQLRWLLSPDRGIYDAMNRGLFAARGDWIWFVNAGDLAHAGLRYESLAAYLRQCNADWVVASARLVGGDSATPGFNNAMAFSTERLWRGQSVPCHQAVFVKRLALAAVSGFDSDYRISADYDLFLKLSTRTAPALWDQVVIDYRVGGASAIRWRRRNVEAALARRRILVKPSRGRQILEGAKLARRLLTPRYVHELRRWRAWRRGSERHPVELGGGREE